MNIGVISLAVNLFFIIFLITTKKLHTGITLHAASVTNNIFRQPAVLRLLHEQLQLGLLTILAPGLQHEGADDDSVKYRYPQVSDGP